MAIRPKAGSAVARGVVLLVLSFCLYLAHVGVSQESDDPMETKTSAGLSARGVLGRDALTRSALRERSRLTNETELAHLRGARGRQGSHGLSTLSSGEARRVSPGQDAAGSTARPPEPLSPEALAPSAFELQLLKYRDPLVGLAVQQFGYDVFRRSTFESVALAVSDSYVLGTGDHVVISVWGNVVDEDFPVTIDRGGQVRLPDVGLVTLTGLRISEAETLLLNKFKKIYFKFELRLRLGKIRDMHVHVIGRVVRPGRLKVPSVATLFDALAAGGGVSKDGSLRRVVLRRRGEAPRTIDLYSYLLDGNLEVDLSLSPGDAVVVPAVGTRVAIVGRVLRPAIYELDSKSGTFEELLGLAGGYARLADRVTVQIESSSSGVLAVETVDLETRVAGNVGVSDGDVLVVREGLPKVENVVYVVGNVARPGRYALRDGMRVSDLLTGDALVSAGFWLGRLPPSGEVAAGARVFDKPANARGRKGIDPSVLIDERSFDKGSDNVDRPDPVSKYPEPFLEYALLRRIDPMTRQERRQAFHLGKAIFERDPKEDLVLQSQDTIVVFPRDAFELKRSVHVSGAVNAPGDHEYFLGMRILDLLRMSGDLLDEAHLESAVLTRVHADQDGARFENLDIDLSAVRDGVPEANLLSQPDDSLAVRVVPDYKRAYRVTIEGEVRQPGVYTVIPGERACRARRRRGGRRSALDQAVGQGTRVRVGEKDRAPCHRRRRLEDMRRRCGDRGNRRGRGLRESRGADRESVPAGSAGADERASRGSVL
jgi:protein involved in polysaccharide export with SLBB domain